MVWYVNRQASSGGDGSREHPFSLIGQAAALAVAGDEVLVAPGIYREAVSPVNAGTAEAPIVYRSVQPRGAVITGAERVTGWEVWQGSIWRVTVPNTLFPERNPYTTRLFGDWLSPEPMSHLGEVFLNGRALYELPTLEQLLSPQPNTSSWEPEFTPYTWYTCPAEGEDATVLYADFREYDPNKECVEITARAYGFCPAREHVDYITLSGFVVTQAATQWAPPTALQEGMVAPHWAKGWVIEDCEISHAKCVGISLGKYRQEGNDNKWLFGKYKNGTQTQRDCTLIAQLDGWSKDTIGSHTVRRCDIHDCGQAGIVGNLGCVFSLIEDNHIHRINIRRNIRGAETGGIKFHAAIDTVVHHNHIHDCTRGIWLDWQAQGTRVSANLLHDNCLSRDHLLRRENKWGLGLGEDLWIEISHGPTLVDNNILLSERAVRMASQGVAFVHNLFGGAITGVGRGVKNGTVKYDSTRYTPIHRPHSTEVTGFMSVLHGDVRFYNNVFVQQPVRQGMRDICLEEHGGDWDDGNLEVGTFCYDGYMTEQEWKDCFAGYCGEGSEGPTDRYYMPLPVWTGGNVFFNGARPCDKEQDYTVDTAHDIRLELTEQDGVWKLKTDLIAYLPAARMITTETLGMAFEPEERFETPDGAPIVFDTDIDGCKRPDIPIAGPFCR